MLCRHNLPTLSFFTPLPENDSLICNFILISKKKERKKGKNRERKEKRKGKEKKEKERPN